MNGAPNGTRTHSCSFASQLDLVTKMVDPICTLLSQQQQEIG